MEPRMHEAKMEHSMDKGKMPSMYGKLAIAITINSILMFFLMYLMIDTIDHFYFTLNNFYMTLAMAAPMVIVMVLVMRQMYKEPKKNRIILVLATIVFILVVFFVRTQTTIGDREFTISMIPHHSSAILMCEKAKLTDPELITLCEEIVQTQQEEIAQMEAILERLD
jgi:hypothetical protein